MLLQGILITTQVSQQLLFSQQDDFCPKRSLLVKTEIKILVCQVFWDLFGSDTERGKYANAAVYQW